MASPKTIELQKKKHVESKREWLWISTNIDYERGTKTKGLTYCKPIMSVLVSPLRLHHVPSPTTTLVTITRMSSTVGATPRGSDPIKPTTVGLVGITRY